VKEDFVVVAEPRAEQGTGASRRLRHAGKLPAIVYGGGESPEMVTLVQKDLLKHLETEAFYSHVLKLDVAGKVQQVILKALHRHPAKPVVMHADFQRVRSDQTIRVHVPLHFLGEDTAPGVKTAGGLLEHLMTDAEVECFPQDLPEFLEVDCSALNIDDTVHLSQLKLPKGVELVELKHDNDRAVAVIHLPRVAKVDDAAEAEDGEAEGDKDGE
jgi:large subunit ribosomal protein L25